MQKIILYSTGCPKCKVLEKKLEQTGLPYILINDVDEVIKKGEELGLQTSPFLLVDDEVYMFESAVKLLTEPNFVPERRD